MHAPGEILNIYFWVQICHWEFQNTPFFHILQSNENQTHPYISHIDQDLNIWKNRKEMGNVHMCVHMLIGEILSLTCDQDKII